MGWTDNPRVDAGEVSVDLHLLSPDLKPLQVVADLKSFWEEDYPALRPMLEVKFPKVDWDSLDLGINRI
jgi:ATP-dependent helicase HrpB